MRRKHAICLIYGLVDPNTLQVRYIGATVNLATRLATHPHERKARAKFEWLASIDFRPRVIVLEHAIPIASKHARERDWIVRGVKMGWPLLNQLARHAEMSDEEFNRIFSLGPRRCPTREEVLEQGRVFRALGLITADGKWGGASLSRARECAPPDARPTSDKDAQDA